MKRMYVCIVAALLASGLQAQENEKQKFSPERFDAELQQFITTEAKLTPEEAAKFFPVYKEMQAKQRELFNKQKDLAMKKPQDEAACEKAIKDRDTNELEMKRIQKAYHKRFLEMMPASKVYDVLQAEDRFHRRMLKRWSRNAPQHRQGKQFQNPWQWPTPFPGNGFQKHRNGFQKPGK
ncbi:MAG: hypothetical protein IKR50_08660 [Prevotella sp.]|nr:hypothetical protein [Prevotella sp.]